MKKIVIVLTLLLVLTGCNEKKEEKPIKKEEKKEETVIKTSPNINLDLIDNEYKETIDEYLSYVPLRKINVFSNDAYSSNLNVNKASKGLLAISSVNVFKRSDTEIKACNEVENCSICFDSNNCILMSEIIEKLDIYYNKIVTPTEILDSLSSKLYLDIDYSNKILKISKVLSFDSNDTDLYIYEKAAFAYKNGDKIEVYKNSLKENKILTIDSSEINSKEVIDEVLNNIDKFNTYKHTFKTREEESDYYYYWYSTEVE